MDQVTSVVVLMGSGVAIDAARPEDAWAVHALFEALHAHNAGLNPSFALASGWEEVLAEHLARIDGAHGQVFLAWDGDDPVGLLMVEGHLDSPLFANRHWAEITALYVAPAWRGQAVADALVEAGRAWARERGFNRVQLYVTSSNVPAKRFYDRVGFEVVQEIWFAPVEVAEAS